MSFSKEINNLKNPEAIGIAVTVQTATLLSISFGSWALMYFFSPSTSLRVKYPKLNSIYARGESIIESTVNRFPAHIRNSKKVDWNRLVTSGTEAWVIRKFFLPFTYPGSIALGIYVATKYSHWRWPEKYIDNDSRINTKYNTNYFEDDDKHDDKPNKQYQNSQEWKQEEQQGDTMFGWNKIERTPSTSQQTQYIDENEFNHTRNDSYNYR